MERYELEKRYEEDDEIDLVELLKSIIREKKLVAVITILFTILAGGFAFYKSSLPKTYSANFSLKNNTSNITLIAKNNFSNKEQLNIYNEKINTFINIKNIENYLSSNDVLSLTNRNSFYTFTSQTEDKDLLEKQREFAGKTDILNENINKFLNKNIDNEISKIQERLIILKEEAEIINKQLKNTIKTYNLNISSDNIADNISIIDPILYIKFEENKNELTVLYSDLKILKTLSENYKDILNLEFNEIKFENSKLNNKLIIAIGIIFGLFAGMFIAIVKEPLKNILKEIKEEK